MKHCEKCNVNVNSTLDYCPLCFNKIEGDHTEPNQHSISKTKPKEITKSHTTRKILFLISLAVVSGCGLINYFSGAPYWWLIVATSVVYLWILVKHTIMSDRNAFEKALFQIIGVVAVLSVTNYVSGGGWFVNYVLPALLSTAVITLDMMLFISKRRRNFEISFLIIELFILIASIIYSLMDICEFKTIHIVTIAVSAFSIIGIIVMDGKNLWHEFSKKMHL